VSRGRQTCWGSSLLSQGLERLTPTPTGESEEDVSRPSSGLEPRRSGTGSVPPPLYLGTKLVASQLRGQLLFNVL
ncbi:hypothetical protein Taro_052148, partial [Colocasia esculenta]|nr:hypothetical protein [Colocasia esculenta]